MEKQYRVKEHYFVDSIRELLVKASSKEEAIRKIQKGDPNIILIDTGEEGGDQAPSYEVTLVVERTPQEKICIRENFRIDFGRAQRDLVDIEYATDETVRLYVEVYPDLVEDFEKVVREELEDTWELCEVPEEDRLTGFEKYKA